MGLFFFGVLLTLVSLFLMLLILVQRGKGGGLTGALGGMGGQSAFGARAGDTFTKITTITAIIWITLCMLTIALFNPPPRTVNTNRDSDQIPADISGAMSAGEETDAEGNPLDESATGEGAGGESDANVIDLLEGGDSNSAGETDNSGQSGSGDTGSDDADTGSGTDSGGGDAAGSAAGGETNQGN